MITMKIVMRAISVIFLSHRKSLRFEVKRCEHLQLLYSQRPSRRPLRRSGRTLLYRLRRLPRKGGQEILLVIDVSPLVKFLIFFKKLLGSLRFCFFFFFFFQALRCSCFLLLCRSLHRSRLQALSVALHRSRHQGHHCSVSCFFQLL